MAKILRTANALPQRGCRELSRLNTSRSFPRYNRYNQFIFSHYDCFSQRNGCSNQKSHTRSFHSKTSEKTDYYELLGVSRDVSKADLKKTYYKLAKKYHPDANPDDKENAQKKFGEISNAYETLSDESRRAAYDQFGHDADQMGGGQDGGFSGFTNAEDLFAQMFGGGGGGGGGNPFEDLFGGGGSRGRSQPRMQRGTDLQAVLEFDFMEAVEGVTKKVDLRCMDTCEPCSGSGTKKGTKPKTCGVCNGSGVQITQQGFMRFEMPCSKCGGQGETKQHCSPCRGQGLIKGSKKVDVKIPAGVDSDTRLRLANSGNAGALGGPRGDLWIQCQVKPHKLFTRDGPDIHLDVPIPVSTAILGGTVAIPTLTGEVNLKIPPGTQPSEKQALRGKGIQSLKRKAKGNMYVHFKVQVPKKLSNEGKQLMEKFAEEEAATVTKANATFFSKIKGFIKKACNEEK